MGENSGIQWTHHTFNPWIGCMKVSPGCANCYAEEWDRRFAAKGSGATRWGPTAPRTRTSGKNWNDPLKWNREAAKAGKRARVFCASLADVFEDRPELIPWRRDLWLLTQKTPWLDWLLLTKRPQHANAMWNRAAIDALEACLVVPAEGGAWAPNVWLGTTVEDQQRAEERIPHLLDVPARVRFLSVEPQLGPVDLSAVDLIADDRAPDDPRCHLNCLTGHIAGPDEFYDGRIHWVIQGGESGGRARPFDVQWMRTTAAQCRTAGVAYFAKQVGAKPFDGDKALRLADGHGGVMGEWPADLQQLGRAFPVSKP